MAVLKITSGGVPVGSYKATFAGYEVQPENKEKGYGAGLRWKFTVTEGPQAGQTASRITGSAPSPKNAAGKILTGLLGRAVAEGEAIDPDTLIGKPYLIVVGAGQNGGTRVEAVATL